MLSTVRMTENFLVVDLDDTPFIGVSGRQVATIERGVELTVLGKRGPYTIVCWGNRNGYVPTDHLISIADSNTTMDEGEIDEPIPMSRPTLNPFRLLPWMRRAA